MEFASKLQQARVARRWTLEQVAEKIGVQRGTVSRWENGHETPHLRYVAALEKLYDMSASEPGLEEAHVPRQRLAS